MLFHVRTRLAVVAVFGALTALALWGGAGSDRQQPLSGSQPQDWLKPAADTGPAVAELFGGLAQPFDQVKLADGETINIEPLAADTLLDLNFPGNVVAKSLSGDQPLVLTSAGLLNYTPYERHALAQLAEFEKTAAELPTLQRLLAAETVLKFALRFNITARERPLKSQSRWDEIKAELDRKLLDVRLALLRERVSAMHARADLIHGEKLAALYPGNSTVLTEAARQRTTYAALLLLFRSSRNTPNYFAEIREQLEWVDEHLPQPPFPGQPSAEIIRQILIGKAAALVAQATQTKDDKAALKLFRAAEEIWPRLPGLHDETLKRQGQYVILTVGVRTLPTYLSPARAVTDSELQAVELLFEGLLKPTPTVDGGHVYAPQLAVSLPRLSDGERHFQLKKTNYWSNGSRVTAADVQKTFELLIHPKFPGRDGEWMAQVESVRMESEAFRVDAKLRKGMLEPLAPFTFKVLPREFSGSPLTAADSEAFALAPVGSGPYMLAGKINDHGRTYLRFIVNPFHVSRLGAERPSIREIRFFVSHDAAADLAHKTAPADLVLDVPAQQLGKLPASCKKLKLPTRRIFFLAVNHRHAALNDPALRRALAHGLDRRAILSECFGGGQALNGPYPAGSWACCADERVPADLFHAANAAAFLKSVKGEAFELELKYPTDDPRAEEACKAIAAQLADLGDQAGRALKTNLIALPAHQLHRDLQTRNYQLAYWRYDYPSELYSLWPLCDPSEDALTSGSNFLGYKDDTWTEMLYKVGSHRDFAEVRRLTHDVHVAFQERMPFIPLWQLDCHVAFQSNVRMPAVDTLRIFADMEAWQVGKQ